MQLAELVGGGMLTPRIEVGGRYDGGDAETGAGWWWAAAWATRCRAWPLAGTSAHVIASRAVEAMESVP